MADVALLASSVQSAGGGYQIPAAQEIILKCCTASFDGTGAAGNFQPALQIQAPNGAVMGTFPTGTTVTAGSKVDVSWFPGLVSDGGGGGAVSRAIQVYPDTADATQNAYPTLTTRLGYTTVRRVLCTFINGANGAWAGSLIVPPDYTSAATLTLYMTADATSGNVKTNVATSVVAVGSSADASYTTEATVTTAVPASANQLFSVAYTLSTTPVAGRLLNVQVNRLGASDTLATSLQLIGCTFAYTD